MITLKQLRKDKGYSYQKMANLLSISKAFYWQIENEKRRLSYETAIRIAEVFNKKPDDIFYNYFNNKK